MMEKCANPICSERFDYSQGRLYCRPMQLLNGSPPANNHGVEHYWLCASARELILSKLRPGSALGSRPAPRSHQKAHFGSRNWPQEPLSLR
jgi:hypothetical protein